MPHTKAGRCTLVLAAACALLGSSSASRAGSIGVPADSIDSSRFTILGQSIGQTFHSTVGLLSALTVWRPPGNRSVIGAHLIVTAVDTTFNPPRPDTKDILLDGPTITVVDGDSASQAIEMRFDIRPPLLLPRDGLYAFFLQPANCYQGEAWNIGANSKNAYPEGMFWITPRSTNDCSLRPVAGGEDFTDLAFTAEFAPNTPRLPEVQLGAPSPNPYSASTRFPLALAATTRVRASIVDAAGRLIRALVDEDRIAGPQDLVWDGNDSRGHRVIPGIYYLRVTAGGQTATRAVSVLR